MKENEKVTTKQCPKCGNKQLLLLYSLNKKCCTDCYITIEWQLDINQKPLLTKL